MFLVASLSLTTRTVTRTTSANIAKDTIAALRSIGRSSPKMFVEAPFLNTDCTMLETVDGNWLTIPTVITKEIPFPIPSSVISSPNHINSIEPPVRAATIKAH